MCIQRNATHQRKLCAYFKGLKTRDDQIRVTDLVRTSLAMRYSVFCTDGLYTPTSGGPKNVSARTFFTSWYLCVKQNGFDGSCETCSKGYLDTEKGSVHDLPCLVLAILQTRKSWIHGLQPCRWIPKSKIWSQHLNYNIGLSRTLIALFLNCMH